MILDVRVDPADSQIFLWAVTEFLGQPATSSNQTPGCRVGCELGLIGLVKSIYPALVSCSPPPPKAGTRREAGTATQVP